MPSSLALRTDLRADDDDRTEGQSEPLNSAALLANLLPQANENLSTPQAGVYMGDRVHQSHKSWQTGLDVEMGEMLPEFWAATRDEISKKAPSTQRSRKVTDISVLT